MDKEEFDKNKNLKGTIVVQSDIKDENIISSSVKLFGFQPGIVTTPEKKLTTTIVSLDDKYRYKVTLEWNNAPINRSYDIIGIGIDSNVKISNNIYFKQTFCALNSNCSSSNLYSKKVTSTGASATYLLPSSMSIVSMNAYFYFDVEKNTTSTIKSLRAYGDYAHSIKSISESNALNHSISKVGIEHLNLTSNYFDTFSLAVATWTGSW